MAQVHRLKTWPTYFDAVERGEKTYEVRRNDRFYQTGDTVILERMREDGSSFYDLRQRTLTFRIGGVLQGGQFGIDPAFCVFSLLPLPSTPEQPEGE